MFHQHPVHIRFHALAQRFTKTGSAVGQPRSHVCQHDQAGAAILAQPGHLPVEVPLGAAAPALVRTVTVDSTPQNGAHSLAVSPDGTRIYLTDAAHGVLRSMMLAPDGAITIGHAPLTLPGSNGYTVDATWYFPNKGQQPVGVIYLQHGYTQTSLNLTALAQDLADRTNSIVVTPTLSSSSYDTYSLANNAPVEQAVATMFEGNRAELTASAGAAAGHSITLPQRLCWPGTPRAATSWRAPQDISQTPERRAI
jgi:hypothetical protein